MKKILSNLLFCAILLFAARTNAQSILIDYWHFNNLTTTAYDSGSASVHIPPIDADYSRLDTAKARMLYMIEAGVSASWPQVATYSITHTYLDPFTASAGTPDYDTVNARMGAIAGTAFRTRNPSDSMELRFYIPTSHYQNIVLKYGCERSGSGMLHQLMDYSVDSGISWSTTGLTSVNDTVLPVFSLHTVSFVAIPAANGNSKLVFRIKFDGNNTTSNGNDRFDNVTLEGDTLITNSIGQVVVTPAFTISPNPVSSHIDVTAAAEMTGDKTITIFDVAGRAVYSGVAGGQQFSIALPALNAGNYFLSIRAANGKEGNVKFTKQ